MKMPQNRFKARLKAGEPQMGFWSSLASPTATEILGQTGADWVLIDTEHAAVDLPDVIHHLRALKGETEALVRPAWNDPVLLKRLLDAGAQSFVVPFVQNAAEARAAVAATRYPPAGIRGVAGANRMARYGRVAGYLREADAEIAVMVQIETRAAVDLLEDILAVEGVDGVFIGPSDLAASMGLIGDIFNPAVLAVIADVAARVARAGGRAGIYCNSEEDVARNRALGFHVLCIGSDLGLLTRGADALVQRLRKAGT